MIAVDTQILVYAHKTEASWHERAAACVKSLAEGAARWSIPWHCLCEFYAIATHPKIYRPCSTPEQASNQIDLWLGSPTLSILDADRDTWPVLRDLALAARIDSGAVHDARIAAVCLRHGVTELWTFDRDFSRFPALQTRNPLIEVQPTRAGERRPPWLAGAPRASSRASAARAR